MNEPACDDRTDDEPREPPELDLYLIYLRRHDEFDNLIDRQRFALLHDPDTGEFISSTSLVPTEPEDG